MKGETKVSPLRFDEIGYWSKVKLEIVRDYAKEYSKILSAQTKPPLHHVYIDGFSGAGIHLAKRTGEFVLGSPLNALHIDPPFREYFLIDLDGDKVDHLHELVGNRPNVHVYKGDCNEILLNQVFPKVRWEQYKRGLCLLDPYGLHLNWNVIQNAGKMKTIDLFLNFPTMDMNRNALWKNPEAIDQDDVSRMTSFWGDDSWKNVAYREDDQLKLFGATKLRKAPNYEVAHAFRNRLKEAGGFKYVRDPLPMKNSKGAVVYYLFFASQNKVADRIISHIFNKYSTRIN
jgi:three-Cys-motif partner protein